MLKTYEEIARACDRLVIKDRIEKQNAETPYQKGLIDGRMSVNRDIAHILRTNAPAAIPCPFPSSSVLGTLPTKEQPDAVSGHFSQVEIDVLKAGLVTWLAKHVRTLPPLEIPGDADIDFAQNLYRKLDMVIVKA